ncbi:unnamed protein product [Amoebophrya sp. A25]|nr:unnamed protein product [Amoebophrya sp. A25]|eukprot:GSA25T00016350001.1
MKQDYAVRGGQSKPKRSSRPRCEKHQGASVFLLEVLDHVFSLFDGQASI